MRIKLSFLFITAFVFIVSLMFALQRPEYTFAAGDNNQIEVNWKCFIEDSGFLGCNLLRYDSLSTVCTQVNDELITADEHVFTFTDTQNVIDTVNYQYDIEYVFSDTTDTQNSIIFALKRIDFVVQSDEDIDVILEFRKNTDYQCDFYVSLDNTGWDMIGQIIINQTDTLSINPYQSCDYLLIEFQDWSMENPFMGFIKLSMDYLIDIIESSDIENDLIKDNRQWIISNFPNPFNLETTISFNLPRNSENPIIEIFNVKGQCIRELKIYPTLFHYDEIGNEKLKINSLIWDGKNHNNTPLSSGVYFYRIKTVTDVSPAMKMLLLK